MKNNLRQKILNELKFLLNEQEEAGGAGMFSEDLDDILEDINDANIKNIAGFDYIDLTTMEDSTDEGELDLLVKSFKNVTKLSQLQDPDAQSAINKICKTNMLLINSFGPTDTYFYVSCKQTSDSKLRVPVSAKKIGSQGQEATFQATIEQIQQGSTPTPPSTPPTGSETGNFCADKKNEGKSVPDLINFVCKDGQAVNTAPGTTPAPNSGQSETGKGNIRCTDEQAIVIYQQWLKYVKGQRVSVDGSYGPLTHAAASAVLKETRTFDEVKKNPNEICKFALVNKTKWSEEITKANPKVVPGQKEAGGGVGGVKARQAPSSGSIFNNLEGAKNEVIRFRPECKNQTDLDAQINAILTNRKSFADTDIKTLKCPAPTEVKKIEEAKILFGKLIKEYTK